MKHFNLPWYFRLIKPLNTYFAAFKRISSIISSDTTDRTKVMSLRLLLVNLENDLNDCEKEVISVQFNHTEDDIQEAFEKVQAGGVQCNLFLN